MKRINVSLPDELHQRIKKHIPWGLTNNVIISLLQGLAIQMEEHEDAVFVDVLNGDFKVVCTNLCARKK